MSDTDTLERTDERTITTDNGDHDRFAHYYAKKNLDRALLEGVEIEALCGKWDRPLRGIEGRQVCPECKAEYDKKNDGPGEHE